MAQNTFLMPYVAGNCGNQAILEMPGVSTPMVEISEKELKVLISKGCLGNTGIF